jgi:hypothetical protein
MSTKARLVLLTLLAVSSTLISPLEAKKMTPCQQAYFMLRHCSSELSGAKNAGEQCCELLSAFDLRECAITDDRVKGFNAKYYNLLSPLRTACDVPVPNLTTKPRSSDGGKNDDILEMVADSLSKSGDSAMYENIISVARAVMATDTNSSKFVTIELAVEGEVEDVTSAVETAVTTAAAMAKASSKKGGIMLQEVSLEVNEDYEDGHDVMCSCQNAELPELTSDAPNSVALRYAYLAARLNICKFTCAHEEVVLGGMILQMAVLGAWIMCLLARPLWARSPSSKRSSSASDVRSRLTGQFIANAGDSQWTEPLLANDEEAGIISAQ